MEVCVVVVGGRAGLVAVFLALLLSSCANLATQPGISLAEEFGGARSGPLLAAPLGLPDYEMVPFLGSGWSFTAGEPLRALGDSEFHFDLSGPCSLILNAETMGPGKVELYLDSRLLSEEVLSDSWSRYVWKLGELEAGAHSVRIKGPVNTVWRDLSVDYESYPPRSIQAEVRDEKIFLPFGRTLEFVQKLPPGARLVVDEVEPWRGKGVALPADWSLQVGVNESTRDLGSALSVDFELNGTGMTKLTLRADCKDPIMGQKGLILKAPRVVFDEVAPKPTEHGPAPEPDSYNVVVIVSDTLRRDRLGCYGYSRGTSSQIDSFADEATVYENAQAQSPWTLPSVASLFTSRLPAQHGVVYFTSTVPDELKTMAEILNHKGYRTGGFVGNGILPRGTGFQRGFQDYRCVPSERPGRLVQSAIEWLNRKDKAPFFLYIHFLQPHAPHDPDSPFRDQYAAGAGIVDYSGDAEKAWDAFWDPEASPLGPQAVQSFSDYYDAEVAGVSDSVGKLLTALKENGSYDDTMVIFLADHGEEIMDHGGFGHINSLYQELVSIPLIIKYPHGLAAGTRVAEPVGQVDILPTVKFGLGVASDGDSGIPLQQGPLDPDRPIYFSGSAGCKDESFRDWYYQGRGVRVGPWVLLRTEEASLNRSRPFELYNLESDPEQRRNLYFERPLVAVTLGSLLAQMNSPEVSAGPARTPDLEVLRGLQYVER